MWLSRIKLTNFRNIESLKFAPDRSVNLISGPNGSGKTSVLEAIFYCCTARSFKGASDEVVRRREADVCRLEVDGTIGERSVQVAIAWGPGEKKQVKVDGVKLARLSELFGYFHAVSFLPEDSEIILGSPSERRRLLDLYISQADRNYLTDLLTYSRVISQRNALLKEFNLDEESDEQMRLLSLWDEQLVDVGARIIDKRLRFLDDCRQQIEDYYRKIEDGESELDCTYDSLIHGDLNVVTLLSEKLHNARRRDLYLGTTSVGPHRDDLQITLNGIPMRAYASQGEAKSAALALKFAIFDYLRDKLGEPPILLLDELSSQLDASRVAGLLKILPDLGQVFLTTTRASELRKGLSIQAEIDLVPGKSTGTETAD
jgi:DNA replication and repair protein RecF